jgi:hypothetical protein
MERQGYAACSLKPQELDRVCDHIVNNELPEPLSVLEGQAGAAGLGKMERIARYNWHHFLRFTRGCGLFTTSYEQAVLIWRGGGQSPSTHSSAQTSPFWTMNFCAASETINARLFPALLRG